MTAAAKRPQVLERVGIRDAGGDELAARRLVVRDDSRLDAAFDARRFRGEEDAAVSFEFGGVAALTEVRASVWRAVGRAVAGAAFCATGFAAVDAGVERQLAFPRIAAFIPPSPPASALRSCGGVMLADR